MVSAHPGRLLVWLLCAVSAAFAQPADQYERRLEDLERNMKLLDPAFRTAAETTLAERLNALEIRMNELLAARTSPAQSVPAPPTQTALVEPVSTSGDYQKSADTETRLPVSGYMEMHFNKERGDPFRPDFHRFVLLFGHSFSSRMKFWGELEVEHALAEGGEESGEVAVEQAYVDFLVKPWMNFRAGMMLTPLGIVNERHEPPSFNGVERPFVETTIIPTTWRELGFGITGDLGRGFRYRAYLGSSLNARGFDAESGIAEGKTSGLDASFRNPAKMARLEYAGVRRLTVGASIYSGHAGFDTRGVNPRVTIAEFDGRYSFRRFDFRGLFVNTSISRTAELNRFLQAQTGVNPNIARELRGYYVEPAVHVLPRKLGADVILFGRYERYNTQHRMEAGFVPLPQFDRSSWVTGVTFKPIPDIAIKFDYDFNRNRSAVVRALDGVNVGIGWWF